MKYGQELPQEVEQRLDNYIERIKKIEWFKPKAELSKDQIEKQVSVILKAFWVEAIIEYRQLKTPKDWDAAWDATWDATLGAALGAARDATRGAARDAALGAARDAARGAYDELLKDNKQYSDKYPNGSFINLVPLYEMGLYPIGVVDWKFVIAIPASKMEFPELK